MTQEPYTIITFAPVQGFIEKSRKLRDLFGSSFLLSYLARSLCDFAKREGHEVIAPATAHLTQGIPNQIIIKGDISEEDAHTHFQGAWENIVRECRQVIEKQLDTYEYGWKRAWDNWKNYCWEFFWAQSPPGGTITQARWKMNEVKRARDWTGINWVGESSTLSGADAIAWPGMLDKAHPRLSRAKAQDIKNEIDSFYKAMSDEWGEPYFDPDERLSIPEIIKRLITHQTVAHRLNINPEDYPTIDLLGNFNDLNRHDKDMWTAWFQGDGDSIGNFLKSRSGDESSPNAAIAEEQALKPFSQAMIKWGENYKIGFNATRLGRIIYAGGDDFLGVLYRDTPDNPLTLQECLEQWIYTFPSKWAKHQQPITVSVGFVWAAPGVPQRDILQHCKLAEKSAKQKGRDRIAIRILFNGGNHLEWTCPWHLLQPILIAYQDREGNATNPNWGHLHEDVQTLLARHAFEKGNSDLARQLFSQIYFRKCSCMEKVIDPDHWFNPKNNFDPAQPYRGGLLGEKGDEIEPTEKQHSAFTDWFIALANMGYHLFDHALTAQPQKLLQNV